MSARGRKPSTPLPGATAGTTTPQPRAPQRPTSPLSPTRHSRLVEKVELQNLNDRLACYIDRVRNLENENARLTVEVHTARETVTRETSNLKSMYESELSDARKLLDETAHEKARLEIDTKRLWEENDALKGRLDKKIKELAIAENSARVYENRCADLSGKYNTACQDRKKAQDECKSLEKENERLRKQLDEFRKQLEDETLARVALENTVQSLKEELVFKDQIHSQELSETRTRRQVEITEIDGRLSQKYEDKLQQSLQELREQYEAHMASNRDNIEALYESKISNLQKQADRNAAAAANAIDELRSTRTKIDSLNSSIGQLEATNATLNARIRDLERMLNEERSRYHDDIAQLEGELQRLRDEMQQQLQEYQDLMDIKVSLDLEIAAYDKLLCGEESRLNITPAANNSQAISTVGFLTQSTRSRATPMRRTPSRNSQPVSAAKRKRVVVDESEDRSMSEYFVTSSAKSDLEISEADPEGRYVKVHNKSAKEANIGGWQLVRTVGQNETQFKFHRSVKVEGGATVTVWSSDTGATHEPPTNIVMKQQKWFVGDNMKTVLLNTENDEMAASERVKQNISSHASRHRSSASTGPGGDERQQQVRGSSATPSSNGSTSVGARSIFSMLF